MGMSTFVDEIKNRLSEPEHWSDGDGLPDLNIDQDGDGISKTNIDGAITGDETSVNFYIGFSCLTLGFISYIWFKRKKQKDTFQ